MKIIYFVIYLTLSLFITNFVTADNITSSGKTFWHFESGQVRPLALSSDGAKLFAVNTPDNHLEIFSVTENGLTPAGSVSVGLEPVAVAVRSDTEVWVVNHLSDSISIVDLSLTPARVVRTLLVGDEPRDIVFAGSPEQPGDPFPRAFITTAHRGQSHDPDISGVKYGDFFTPSMGRADVWVFDANNLGSSLAGTPETILTLFGDTPRALVATPSGDKVYAAIFHSGNQTMATPIRGGATRRPSPSQVPTSSSIVKFNGVSWVDENGTVESGARLQLPDMDVFEIDADAATPVELRSFSSVGTILFNMVIDPASEKLYVSNTEANNLITTEPGLKAKLHQSRISVIDNAGVVQPRHLNKHINYNNFPSPAGTSDDSLATPMGMAISSDGKLYVAAFGSSKIGVFSVAELDNDSFTPDVSTHISISGGGPSAIVLDEARDRLYVMARFNNSIAIVDRTAEAEIDSVLLHNPEPDFIKDGRPFLYDTNLSSSNGEASCAGCHPFGQMDSLSWNLGAPADPVLLGTNPFLDGVPPFITPYLHPLKGPMVTQSLRGMDNHGPMHWRGDKSAALDGGVFNDEEANFKKFNPIFVSLFGRSAELTAPQMQAFTDFILALNYPPNPIRNLDNSLNVSETTGEELFQVTLTFPSDPPGNEKTCENCHTMEPENGFFGTEGLTRWQPTPQDFKIPHFRNLYQKVGMFGAIPTDFISPVVTILMFTPSMGPANQPQIRGYGYGHDGAMDSLLSLHDSFVDGDLDGEQVQFPLFEYPGDRATAIQDISNFMLITPAELNPIVGQQVTLTSNNSAVVSERIDLLISRSQIAYPSPASLQQKECDLIVKGVVGDVERNWFFNISTGLFDSDLSGEAAFSDASVRALVNDGGQLTYTCAPPGSGQRMALDRDMDGLLNFDERSVYFSNPANADSDGDSVVDNSDNCMLTSNSGQLDTNGDGYGNICDADLDNIGVVNFGDLAVFRVAFGTADPDADLNGDGVVNFADLAVFRSSFGKPPGPSAIAP